MNFSLFGWLRRKAAEAVVGGVADALKAVAPEGEEVASVDDLRALLAAAVQPKALPAGDDVQDAEAQPAKGKGGKSK